MHRSGVELILAESRDVDIRDRGLVQKLVRQHRPNWIVLAGAYSDGCEQNPSLPMRSTMWGAVNFAQACHEHDDRLLFISTDYVFDGKKRSPYETDDLVCPPPQATQQLSAR